MEVCKIKNIFLQPTNGVKTLGVTPSPEARAMSLN